MKVYCRNCKCWSWGERETVICLHPNNMKDNFYAQKSVPILSAEERNENNDCPDYIDAKLEKMREKLYEESQKIFNKKWFEFWK